MRDRLSTDYAWTPRQRDVLDGIAQGKTNPEIADELGISRDGVKYHVGEVLSKLGVDSREEAAEYWRRHNGLAPKFARIFRSLSPVAALRWAMGAVLVAGVTSAVVAVIVFRGGDDEIAADPSSTASPAITATSTAAPGIAGKDSTGDPALDAVITAVVSGDRALMETYLELVDSPCEPPESVTGNPCGSDPPGTMRKAFPHAGCDESETGWTTGQFPWIDTRQAWDPKPYAVYRQDPEPARPPKTPPRGSAVVVFETVQNNGFAIDVQDGRIVAERGPCGPFPYPFIDGIAKSRFILLPAGGIPVPTPTIVPRPTGDPATDRIVTALVDGDITTIASLFTLLPEPCAVNPQGVGSRPKCPPGVPDGGEVQMARAMACERAYLSTPDDFEQLLASRYRFPHWLYAAYRTDGSLKFNFVPTGNLALVIAEGLGTNGEAASIWYVEDGRIVGAWLGCGGGPDAAIDGIPAADFILPPQP